jgi:hypothetical protein
VVNGFVEEILTHDPNARAIVLRDFNDYEYSETLEVLRGDDLANLTDELGPDERYSYVFQGNSQALDHLLVVRAWPTATRSEVEMHDVGGSRKHRDCVLHGCPCGYHGDPRRACNCAPGAIARYQKR